MGDLIPLQVLLIKRIRRDAKKELHDLYKNTAGFQDPDIPTKDEREQFDQGQLEL